MSVNKDQSEVIAERNAEIAERKVAEIKAGFLNPYGIETSYVEFLAAVKTAKVTVEEYCKDKLTSDEIAWLLNELLTIK